MHDFLERFQNRMEFCAIIGSIVNRKNKSTEIENMFEPCEFDNLIVSVLVFIMENTLSEDKICTLKEINAFIIETLPVYNKSFSYEQTEEPTQFERRLNSNIKQVSSNEYSALVNEICWSGSSTTRMC